MSTPAPNENDVPSSPIRQRSGKERKSPSITPRKFRQFFTPRSRATSQPSRASRALRDIGASTINQRFQTSISSSPLKPFSEEEAENDDAAPDAGRSVKRRKLEFALDSSPTRPLRRKDSHEVGAALASPPQSSQEICESDSDYSEDDLPVPICPPKRLTPLTRRGLSGQLAQREFGGLPRAGRAHMTYPTTDFRIHTADFSSNPDDRHCCVSFADERGERLAIPFCVTTCHRSALAVVGDEEGCVRILNSSDDSAHPFDYIHGTATPHANAIIDLHFSDDDSLLATASGDQTGRVMDMQTLSVTAVLGLHEASLKQIRFQPGQANSSILATSSRDGSIQIWDLRCSRPTQEFQAHESRNPNLTYRAPPAKRGSAINSFYHAHEQVGHHIWHSGARDSGDMPTRHEIPSRSNSISVTALQFLPAGREYLMLTGCEADASIKLWDIRNIHSSHTATPPALAVTAPPQRHLSFRSFGINSLALSTDGARFYALCKDSTVYAYSTAHLMLGEAPELASRKEGPPRARHITSPQQGMGPLYGFSHPSFYTSSFYNKCAIRPARDGQSELLAVGSGDSCAVLFATDERYFEAQLRGDVPGSISPRERLAHKPFSRTDPMVPHVNTGTPLVRGHQGEVNAVAWTNEGKLITVGDDFYIRAWREDRARAADLRTGGETGGRRWACGWAGEGWEDWDEEECE